MPPRLASLLSLLQLSDSAFPSGRYTLSYGLETLVQSGRLPVPAETSTLTALLGDSIRFAAAPSDGAALACAHRAVGADGDVDLDLVVRVDARLTAVKLPREARDASARTGRAVLGTAAAAIGGSALHDYTEFVKAGRAGGGTTRSSSGCSAPSWGCRVSRRWRASFTRSRPAGSPRRSGWALWITVALRRCCIDRATSSPTRHCGWSTGRSIRS